MKFYILLLLFVLSCQKLLVLPISNNNTSSIVYRIIINNTNEYCMLNYSIYNNDAVIFNSKLTNNITNNINVTGNFIFHFNANNCNNSNDFIILKVFLNKTIFTYKLELSNNFNSNVAELNPGWIGLIVVASLYVGPIIIIVILAILFGIFILITYCLAYCYVCTEKCPHIHYVVEGFLNLITCKCCSRTIFGFFLKILVHACCVIFCLPCLLLCQYKKYKIEHMRKLKEQARLNEIKLKEQARLEEIKLKEQARLDEINFVKEFNERKRIVSIKAKPKAYADMFIITTKK